eukprot:c14008_g1_i1.p1 GENE.c14008_g1_i1~~c14008_g1_i1.p1  ORF type:complete len:346 (-),score=87.27 c14008_g1_i1:96-1079(-)
MTTVSTQKPRVVGVGIACMDIILSISKFPMEDGQSPVHDKRLCRGGNSANSLSVATQFGTECFLLFAVGDEHKDINTKLVLEDLHSFGVDTSIGVVFPNTELSCSYIAFNRENSSRTIFHHRTLPELTFEQMKQAFDTLAIKTANNTNTSKEQQPPFDWVHFEGRNVEETLKCMQFLRSKYDSQITLSVELEKAQRPLHLLVPEADVVFMSKEFAEPHSITSSPIALEALTNGRFGALRANAKCSCTWGADGAYVIDTATTNNKAIHIESVLPANKHIVDSIGAGDTYNGVVIALLAQGVPLKDAAIKACEVAAKKITQLGFRDLVV